VRSPFVTEFATGFNETVWKLRETMMLENVTLVAEVLEVETFDCGPVATTQRTEIRLDVGEFYVSALFIAGLQYVAVAFTHRSTLYDYFSTGCGQYVKNRPLCSRSCLY